MSDQGFGLIWPGKDKITQVWQKSTNAYFQVSPKESVRYHHTNNLFIEGDNLVALKLLQTEFYHRVKLIYIDPPYNTGHTFVYSDKFYQQGYQKESQKHSNWLTMMYPRLQLAKSLLAEDGMIMISIGVNELCHLKLIMDEIFHEKNFIEIFSWVKTATPPALSAKSRKTNEYILCYEKNKNAIKYRGKPLAGGSQPLLNTSNLAQTLTFPKGSIHFSPKFFKDGYHHKRKYPKVTLLNRLSIKNGISQNEIKIHGHFKWSQKFLDQEIQQGTYFVVKSDQFSIRFIRDQVGFKRPNNQLEDQFETPLIDKAHQGVDTNEAASAELRTLMSAHVFDYPKPVSLLKFLINFVANDGDIILDFFAGSGTTMHAAFEWAIENQQNLQTILVQQPEALNPKLKHAYIQNGIDLLTRLKKPTNIAEIAKERLRRCICSLEQQQANLGIELDLGFQVRKIQSD